MLSRARRCRRCRARDPVSSERVTSALTKICVGFATDAVTVTGVHQRRFRHARAEVWIPARARCPHWFPSRGDRLHLRVDRKIVAHRSHRHDRAVLRLEGGGDRHRDLIFVVLQRANGCAVAVGQIVPGPTLPPAWLLEGVVVANDAPVNRMQTTGLQRAAQSSKARPRSAWRGLIDGSPLPTTTRSPPECRCIDGPVARRRVVNW